MKQATTRAMFSYWDRLRGERAAPERGEIDPGAIRDILADTFILELDADRSACIRLAGTRLCALFGAELKGRPFASLWAEPFAAETRGLVDAVVADTTGLLLGLRGETQKGMSLDLEMLLLPLRHRGKPHVRILGAVTPASIPSWAGLEPLSHWRTHSLRVIAPYSRRTPLQKQGRPAPDNGPRFVVYRGGRA